MNSVRVSSTPGKFAIACGLPLSELARNARDFVLDQAQNRHTGQAECGG